MGSSQKRDKEENGVIKKKGKTCIIHLNTCIYRMKNNLIFYFFFLINILIRCLNYPTDKKILSSSSTKNPNY